MLIESAVKEILFKMTGLDPNYLWKRLMVAVRSPSMTPAKIAGVFEEPPVKKWHIINVL